MCLLAIRYWRWCESVWDRHDVEEYKSLLTAQLPHLTAYPSLQSDSTIDTRQQISTSTGLLPMSLKLGVKPLT
jgi:hypothetical protein